MSESSWDLWVSTHQDIAQRLRGIADYWDLGLTTEDRLRLSVACDNLGNLAYEMAGAIAEIPETPAEAAGRAADAAELQIGPER